MDLQSYGKYKTTEQTLMRSIPHHWDVQKLKFHVCKVGSGVTPKGGAESYDLSEIPLLRSQNVHFDGLRLDDVVFIDEDVHASMNNSKVADGDVLLNITGASIGRCTFVTKSLGEANVNQHVCIVRPEDSMSTRFLCYVLSSDIGQEQIELEQSGSGREGLNFSSLKNFWIPLVSEEEQQQIADFLDWKTGQIDRLIAKKRSLLAALSEQRMAVITSAVTRGLDPTAPLKDSGIPWLGKVPRHWEVMRLKFLTINSGDPGIQIGPFGGMLTDLIHGTDGPYKLYGQENVLSGNFNKGTRWFDGERFTALSKYAAEPGDILFTRKGSIGGCAIFPEDCHPGIIDSDTIRLRLNSELMSVEYLFHAFKHSDYLQHQVVLSKRGAILSGLNTTTIADLVVAVPPTDEQTSILSFVRSQITRIAGLFAKTERNYSAV